MTITRDGDPIGDPVPGWTPRPLPARAPMPGRYCRLEPLSPDAHARDLWEANALDATGRNFTYLMTEPFTTFDAHEAWLAQMAAKADPLFFAVLTPGGSAHRAVGVASYLRIAPEARVHRGRPHQLLAAAPADARGHRGDVPDDAARLRARLPALRVEVRRAQRALARGRRSGSASRSRACSARRSSTRAAVATPRGTPSIDTEWPRARGGVRALARPGQLRRRRPAARGAR